MIFTTSLEHSIPSETKRDEQKNNNPPKGVASLLPSTCMDHMNIATTDDAFRNYDSNNHQPENPDAEYDNLLAKTVSPSAFSAWSKIDNTGAFNKQLLKEHERQDNPNGGVGSINNINDGEKGGGSPLSSFASRQHRELSWITVFCYGVGHFLNDMTAACW